MHLIYFYHFVNHVYDSHAIYDYNRSSKRLSIAKWLSFTVTRDDNYIYMMIDTVLNLNELFTGFVEVRDQS